jgi:cardiolipin synthase
MKIIFRHIPNLLTVIRFLLIPIIIIMLVNGNYIGAVVVFSISGITDILDRCNCKKI